MGCIRAQQDHHEVGNDKMFKSNHRACSLNLRSMKDVENKLMIQRKEFADVAAR
jgi:hypothetical protein